MPGPLTLGEIFRMPELYLGVAAVLVAVVGGTSIAYGNVQEGIMTLATALIMLMSVVVSLGYFGGRGLKGMFSLATISMAMGLLLLVNSVLSFVVGGWGWWTTWTTLASSLLSLFAAYLSLPPRSP